MIKLLIIIASLAVGMLCGFTFMNLWNWFITDFGVMALTFPHAYGLLMFYALLRYKHTDPLSTTEQWNRIIEVILLNLLILGLGYLAASYQ